MWKFFASIYVGKEYVRTQHVPVEKFIGKYYQLMQTPNPFQKTGLASATYYFDDSDSNVEDVCSGDSHHAGNESRHPKTTINCRKKGINKKNRKKAPQIKVLNREYKILNGRAVIDSQITGYIQETTADPGTFFVFFDNKYAPGLYRILDYEQHPRFGIFLFVSSILPKYSWLLWKPPLDKSNLGNAYTYALTKIKLFEKINIHKDDVIVVSPTDLYMMIQLNTSLF